MPDAAAVWTLDDLLALHAQSLTLAHPVVASGHFTLALWLYPTRLDRRQVILHAGDPAAPLLELALDGGRLALACAESVAVTPLLDAHHWYRLIIAVDCTRPRINAWLNGVPFTPPLDTAPPPFARVTVGGYTDPAGGHFEHTFGRQGQGFISEVTLYAGALTAHDRPPWEPASAPAPVVSAEPRLAADPASPVVTLSVPDAPGIQHVLWDLGDGQVAAGTSVRHTYAFAGAYRVQAIVTGQHYVSDHAHLTVRIGGAAAPTRVTVFANASEGFACYRIPAVVRCVNGDLLAFAEGRVESCSDSAHTIRLVSKRSTDGGRMWEPVQEVTRSMGEHGERVCHNPAPVVDTVYGTGRVIVLVNKAQHTEWDLARGIGRSRCILLTSDDHGRTWHERDISDDVHRWPEWRVQRPTLGHAIQLQHGPHRGRIVHAGVITEGDASVFESRNYIFYSDDLGGRWHVAGILPWVGLNEATLAELPDGSLIVNTRAYQGGVACGLRAVTCLRFTPEDALEVIEATRLDPALTDPAVQASLLALPDGRLAFCNPANRGARIGLTLRISADGGRTWPVSRLIDPGPSAYSDLVMIDDRHLGILYERGNQGGIALVSLPLDSFGADSRA
jgi:sialidase-1